MSLPNYRVIVLYDHGQKVFRARAAELEHCFGEGATRAEAISNLELEIQAQLQNMQEQSKTPPRAIDDQEWTGDISVHVSKQLHRDLAWQARIEGVELNQFLSEMIAAGLEQRRPASRPQRTHSRDRQPDGNRSHSSNRHERDGHSNYTGMFEDRANFIQYVRSIDDGHRDGQSRGKDKPRGHQKHHHKRRHGRKPGHTSHGEGRNAQEEVKDTASLEHGAQGGGYESTQPPPTASQAPSSES